MKGDNDPCVFTEGMLRQIKILERKRKVDHNRLAALEEKVEAVDQFDTLWRNKVNALADRVSALEVQNAFLDPGADDPGDTRHLENVYKVALGLVETMFEFRGRLRKMEAHGHTTEHGDHVHPSEPEQGEEDGIDAVIGEAITEGMWATIERDKATIERLEETVERLMEDNAKDFVAGAVASRQLAAANALLAKWLHWSWAPDEAPAVLTRQHLANTVEP